MTLTKTQIAIKKNRTLFPKTVKSVLAMTGSEEVLKLSTNKKLGNKVTIGKFKGFPIYTLTLEERKTCPSDCGHYKKCYGNNMHLAIRYKADKALLEALRARLAQLHAKHPKGFLVRLHVLGDFFSPAYVRFWRDQLNLFPSLHIYGYSARKALDPIGEELDIVRKSFPTRFVIRASGNFQRRLSALSYDNPKSEKLIQSKKAFLCPTQITHKESRTIAKKGETTLVPNCGACGLCWTSNKPVVFLTH